VDVAEVIGGVVGEVRLDRVPGVLLRRVLGAAAAGGDQDETDERQRADASADDVDP
jgi:hypothetical protein